MLNECIKTIKYYVFSMDFICWNSFKIERKQIYLHVIKSSLDSICGTKCGNDPPSVAIFDLTRMTCLY